MACAGRYARFQLHLVLHHRCRKPAGFRIARDATAGQEPWPVRSGGEGWAPGIRNTLDMHGVAVMARVGGDVRHRCATSRPLGSPAAGYRSPGRPDSAVTNRARWHSVFKNRSSAAFWMESWIGSFCWMADPSAMSLRCRTVERFLPSSFCQILRDEQKTSAAGRPAHGVWDASRRSSASERKLAKWSAAAKIGWFGLQVYRAGHEGTRGH
jgi:hypothetical protein